MVVVVESVSGGRGWRRISLRLSHSGHFAPLLERLGLIGPDDEAGELHEVQIG
jgi:hypothetical protein